MASLLQPSTAINGFSRGLKGNALRGFALGDHVEEDHSADPTNAVTVPRNSATTHHRWFPYSLCGGSVVSVSGENYCVVASDTRYAPTGGYSLGARNVSRVIKLTSKAVLASAGSQAESTVLHKTLKNRLVMYEQDHGKEMPIRALAQMLSALLYYKRFFPYYTFNVLGGVDENGTGCAFGYDPIGSFDSVRTGCTGTGMMLIQPVLDNQIECKQQYEGEHAKCSLEEAINTVKDAFSTAGERDIYTGDTVELYKITSEGIAEEKFELKKD